MYKHSCKDKTQKVLAKLYNVTKLKCIETERKQMKQTVQTHSYFR